ncbi:hypothetical protein PENSUB_9636 [Penicillium subrubescens]|uniref:Non-reducing end beta-L-arabinofuranosidase n=1 Tax=Penicillium subrubescens TaxID=1316194 RepID=A0A1Q5TCV8_9EURO|nr:hypothetical protein PENSUB_9636 [Penicillium subrubescens]
MYITLAPFTHSTFPLGSIKATGWLHDQLVLEANGLAGHLFDFYRYVANSTWVGGTYEYSELHESAPYWFNYIVPLAFTLDEVRLKDQARQFLDYVIDHQAADGWLGPETTRQTRGIWARSLLFFALMQYAEADTAQTDRIVTAMHNFTRLANTMLKNNFTGLIQQKSQNDDFDPYGFGLSRTHELPLALQWLYENHPRNNSDVIWETMDLMFAGGRLGARDWTTFFVEGVFPKLGTPYIKTSGFTHGVNLAEAQTGNAVNMTYFYQSTRAGSITADEHLGGLSPQRGSETCMAAEMMFSMAYLFRFYGINQYADKAELAAFNAFPAALTPDWWAHQYVQQTNQPWSRNLTARPYANVVSYGNTFGLEPNFPCCTVNHGQGYPKYVASSYVREKEDHIVHALLGPTTLHTTVNGKNVLISCKTNYPFSGKLVYAITSATDLNFSVRIPSWTNSTGHNNYTVNGSKPKPLAPDFAGLQTVSIEKGQTQLEINLEFPVQITEPRNGSVAIHYGPLLYALDVKYANASYHSPLNWTDRAPLPTDQITPGTHEWVLDPTSDWQYAIDPTSVTVEQLHNPDKDLQNPVWTRDAVPVALWVDAWLIDWAQSSGTAAVPPQNPIVTGNATRVRLIPYGAAKLRTADFSVAQKVAAS